MFFTGTYIRVIDPSYTTLEAFVASLAGQYLIYELATPIRIDFDSPLDLSYKVYEGGMEKAVSEAPMRAVVAYQKDYVKEINKLPQNYQSQESMDSLLLVLGTALGGTFTKSWDGMKWSYTFTPNNS